MTPAGRLETLRAAHADVLAGRFDAALNRVTALAGDPAGALLHALALAGSGAVDEAAPLLARIAAANPDSDHPVQDLLTLVPAAAGLRHLRAAVRERPDDPRLLAGLGAALAEAGPMEEAVAAFRRAIELRPSEPAGWSNYGKALAAGAQFEAAEAAFATALRLAPDSAQVAHNRAIMLLKAGRFAEGWPALRARHSLPNRPPPVPGPRLDTIDVNAVDIAGRTVLLVHDEGFGDTLQFIRYAPLLAERGARVVAAMPAPLTRLIRTAPGVAEATTLPILPRYDFWMPLLDVPALFGDMIPNDVPYLRAPGRAPSLPPGCKIGLAWRGDPNGLLDRSRSMPQAALEPLRGMSGVTWVSLQKDITPPGWMLDPMPSVGDFADTAAIVMQLDAVVSVDTAIAHLAGALAKPVLLMDRYDNCWRWLSGRDDSPWYPKLRIIRQTAPGDWESVVRRVGGALGAMPQ